MDEKTQESTEFIEGCYFPVAVWLTRHTILPEQIEWFESRGFEVKTLHDHANGDETMFKFVSGAQAWQLANDVAGRTLRKGDVAYAILTDSHKPEFLKLAQGNDVKWLATKMEYITRTPDGVETAWSGTFDVVIRVFEAEYEPFDPASQAKKWLMDDETVQFYQKSPQYGCSITHYAYYNYGYVANVEDGYILQSVDSFTNSNITRFDSLKELLGAMLAIAPLSKWKLSEE